MWHYVTLSNRRTQPVCIRNFSVLLSSLWWAIAVYIEAYKFPIPDFKQNKKKPLGILTERLYENAWTSDSIAAYFSYRLKPGVFALITSLLTAFILHFLCIALFAVNGTVSTGLEGNFTLFLATRTYCFMHFPWGFVISILKSHDPSSFRNLF